MLKVVIDLGKRVIILESLQQQLLKAVAWISSIVCGNVLCWNALQNRVIENLSSSHHSCLHAASPLHPCIQPDASCSHNHVDVIRSFIGCMFSVFSDTHSKQPKSWQFLQPPQRRLFKFEFDVCTSCTDYKPKKGAWFTSAGCANCKLCKAHFNCTIPSSFQLVK